jgi:tRNA 2-thiouridine synthesizing protein B
MLHLVNKILNSSSTLLSLLRPKDGILLLEEGVYQGIKTKDFVASCIARGARCYALLPDVSARGLHTQMHLEIELISYEQFVELSLQHHPILNWSA